MTYTFNYPLFTDKCLALIKSNLNEIVFKVKYDNKLQICIYEYTQSYVKISNFDKCM